MTSVSVSTEPLAPAGAPAGGITAADVSFAYAAHGADPGETVLGAPALLDVSHAFAPGTATLVTGVSGCGKSTLLRVLNGLIPHVTPGELTGRVEVDGLETTATPLHDLGRHVATVFQNPRTQFFAPTVREELAFARQQAGLPREEILAVVDDVAGRLGLRDLLDRSLHTLSGGQLQRVACAAALAGEPRIVLFDEPTGNLSPEAIDDVAAVMAQMRAAGHTIVVVEHRLFYLRGLVDRVVTMRDGRLSRVWDAQDFFARPDDERRAAGLRTLSPPALPELVPAADSADAGSGLVAEGLRFAYGRRRVLDIERVAFPRGRVTALVGPNGAGKTTLCRVLVGLARAEKGARLTWDGADVSPRERLAIGAVVMQDVHRQLFAESVRAELRTGSSRVAEADVEGILDQLDLADVADRHPMSLSGGQKQRLVIAAALATDAEFVVLDEPTSGVDLRHLERIAQRTRALADAGCAVVVVSHDLEFVAACADRIVRLEPGPGGSAVTEVADVRRDPPRR